MSRSERHELLLRCRDNLADPEHFLSGWQLDSTSNDKIIRRENVKDWLLWGFFSAGQEALSEPDVTEEIEEYVDILEESLGRTIPPGRNENIKSIRLTLDNVVIHHRPFVWYMIVMIVDILVAARMRLSGFKHYSAPVSVFPPRPYTLFSRRSPSKVLSYWYRPPAELKTPVDQQLYPPLLFIHGIGIGLFPYTPLLCGYDKKHPDVPIIVPEILSISSRLTRPALSHEEFRGAITDIFNHHGVQEYSITAHSYGTALAAGIVKATNSSSPNTDPISPTPELNHAPSLPAPRSLTLLDPICLLLHLPSVARNFLYRPPKQANEHELYYFACTDPGVAHTLSRHFFWAQNILWKEDLAHIGKRSIDADQSTPRVAIVLSGSDIIVDAPAVWTYLTGLPPPENRCAKPWPFIPPVPHVKSLAPRLCESLPNVLAVYLGGLDHAQMFLSSVSWRGVLDVMEQVSGIWSEQ
ncbi:hypothetical protein FRC12_011891 [Ceratobasidium sp. 428]|nr:hypothetical protein FRC12_011891 [Ceratobasidium sp. 428]